MPNQTEHFELFGYLESLFDDKLNMIFTAQPATIESFNADENTVSVTLDKEGLNLQDIPISLFGNPSSYITTPTLEKGTKGLLIFSKHDLYSWVEDGVDSHAKTDFSKNNAFFLIGATNQKNKITYNLNAIELKTDKAIQSFSEDNTEIDSKSDIKLTASGKIENTSGDNIELTASKDINSTAIKITLKGSASVDVEAPAINLTSPSIVMGGGAIAMGGGAGAGSMQIGSKNGDDLATLLEELSTELSSFASVVSSLTGGATPYIAKFEELATKFGGFK